MSRYDVAALRATEYPRAAEATYMNAAGVGPIPARARRRMEELAEVRSAPHLLRDGEIPEGLAAARAALGRLVGGEPAEIALTPNTNVGIAIGTQLLLGRALNGRESRRRIVLSEGEFPANVYPWLSLERHGFAVERVPTDALGRPDEDRLLEALDRPDVAAFALSAVQFSTGWGADLARFGEVCGRREILYVVDAIQALGAAPLEPRPAGIDLLAAGGQKWLCGPWGSGFAWVRPELLREEPLIAGWLSFTSSADFSRLTDYRWELLPDARRFEMGTIPLQAFLGLTRAVELILELGLEAIRDHIRDVQAPLLEWIDGRDDITVVSPRDEPHRSAIACLRPPDAPRVHGALTAAGVVCALREGAIRLAPHFYNTPEEMARVVDVLDGAVAG